MYCCNWYNSWLLKLVQAGTTEISEQETGDDGGGWTISNLIKVF